MTPTFTVGEEVHFEELRYVVSSLDGGRVRLLASTPVGARFAWTTPDRLEKIDAYTRSGSEGPRAARRR
ncbi:hypothetical protein BH23DEI1_BH23DEI1_00320 [soil metagenome]|nr:hypothetical protein [Trueperaceae bacterium]